MNPIPPQPWRKVSAPYGSVIFALVCLTAMIAAGVFHLAFATAQGSPAAFGAVNTSLIIGIFGIGMWATRSWSTVRTAEPETDPVFRRKHRAFEMKAGTLILGVIIGVVAIGAYLGVRAGHKAKLDVLSKEMHELGLKSAPTKERFVALTTKTAPGLPEYLQRCEQLEAVLNDYEPALKQMDNLMNQMQQELQELNSDPGYASLLPVVTVMRAVVAKDLESAKTFRKEIDYAKQLPNVPESDRTRFYSANIQPVVEQEGRIAQDEIEILKDAKARGVKLPESMYQQVGLT